MCLTRNHCGTTAMTISRTRTARSGLRFANKFTIARRAVPARSRAVVHEGVRVQPHLWVSDAARERVSRSMRRRLSTDPAQGICGFMQIGQRPNGDDRMQLEAIRGHAALAM